MTQEPATILVIGATGAQGGAVAHHLLRDGRYGVRCLTRSPDSPSALELRRRGAEIAVGNLSDPDSLQTAFRGVACAFGVTAYWEHFEAELEHGRNIIDAAAHAGIDHLVMSTLESSVRLSGGEIVVPHIETKAAIEDYARDRLVDPIFVHPAFFFENFLTFFPPRRQADGTLGFGFPQGDTPLAGVAVDDIGAVVAAVLARPQDYAGQTIGIVGDDLPPASYAEAMTKVLGERVTYSHVPREAFAGFGFPGAEDLAAMFDFNRRFIPDRRTDIEASLAVRPAMQRFETWMAAHARHFTPMLAA